MYLIYTYIYTRLIYTQFIRPKDVQGTGSGGCLHKDGVKNWRENIHITFRILWCLVHGAVCVCFLF